MKHAYDAMQAAFAEARTLGAIISAASGLTGNGVYVRPAIVEMTAA